MLPNFAAAALLAALAMRARKSHQIGPGKRTITSRRYQDRSRHDSRALRVLRSIRGVGRPPSAEVQHARANANLGILLGRAPA